MFASEYSLLCAGQILFVPGKGAQYHSKILNHNARIGLKIASMRNFLRRSVEVVKIAKVGKNDKKW